MTIVLVMVAALGLAIWRYVRSLRPKCQCGADGFLLRRQETGQRTIFHYRCRNWQCGKVWEVPEPSFEARRVSTTN